MGATRLLVGILGGLCVAAAQAGPPRAGDSLTVLANGASRATVYVAPLSSLPGQSDSTGDVSPRLFLSRFRHGSTPMQMGMAPGDYVVAVAPTAQYELRDALQRARELIWDGFSQHAVVLMADSERWRYARCYAVTKEKDVPLTVFAVFTGREQIEESATFSPTGGQGVKFTGGEDMAREQLDAGGAPTRYFEELVDAVTAGRKAILTTGRTRWIITVEGPETLRVQQGSGVGNWSGYRLSTVTVD